MTRPAAQRLYETWAADLAQEVGPVRPWETLPQAEQFAWAYLSSHLRGAYLELMVKAETVRVWLRHGSPEAERERMVERLDVIVGALRRWSAP